MGETDDQTWQVVRLVADDGGELLVRDKLTQTEAEALLNELTERTLRSQFRAEPMRQLSAPSFEYSIKRTGSICALDPNLICAAQLENLRIDNLARAVIFYHGGWSGTSVSALRLLCRVMAEATTKFQIIVVNADELGDNCDNKTFDKAKMLFGPSIGAWGETCWIKGGRIIARDILGKPITAEGPLEPRAIIESRIAEVIA